MTLNDELICAYLDGELDAEKRAEVETMLQTSGGGVARLERMRSADDLMRRAFPSYASAQGDPLAAQIMGPIEARVKAFHLWRQAGAIAAAALLGVVGANMVATFGDGAGASRLSGRTAALLETMPSGITARTDNGVMNIEFSVRTEGGAPCRVYRVQSSSEMIEGLACREGGEWRGVAQSVVAQHDAGDFVTAGGGSIDAALVALGNAEALPREQENLLLESAWVAR